MRVDATCHAELHPNQSCNRKIIFYHTCGGYSYIRVDFGCYFYFFRSLISFKTKSLAIFQHHEKVSACLHFSLSIHCEMQSDKLHFFCWFSLFPLYIPSVPEFQIYCFKFLSWILCLPLNHGAWLIFFIFSDPKKIDYTFINIEFEVGQSMKAFSWCIRILEDFRRITLHKLFISASVFFHFYWVFELK